MADEGSEGLTDKRDSTVSRSTAQGLIFILSGPSGVGKDAIRAQLQAEDFPITFCVTATSRVPRPSEIDGVHYRFLKVEDFESMEQAGELLEHAMVHGRHYGVPLRHVSEGLRQGKDVLITVDVQGGETVRRKLDRAITIFLAPPTLEALVPRLASRGTEDEAERAIRLATAAKEMDRLPFYDYVVVNEQGRLLDAVEQIKSIIVAERCRVHPSLVTL
ncbi:MAG: guanylate kinase [Chloroflexota bacterium]